METSKLNANKAYILGALVITISLVIIGVSMSYAYFVNTVQEVEAHKSNKGVTITSGALDMNFATTQTINASAVGLINASEVTTKANHTDFSIALPSTAKVNSAKYQVYLTDLNISSNLKSTYFKWALYKGSTSVKSGNFSAVTGTTLTLLDSVSISKGTTDSYKLYIWLENNPNVNQTSLLNGSFSGKVGFTATT